LDLSQLQVPQFDDGEITPGRALTERELLAALSTTYDFNGPVRGATMYSPKRPMYDR
jgi:hypothetical protein